MILWVTCPESSMRLSRNPPIESPILRKKRVSKETKKPGKEERTCKIDHVHQETTFFFSFPGFLVSLAISFIIDLATESSRWNGIIT